MEEPHTNIAALAANQQALREWESQKVDYEKANGKKKGGPMAPKLIDLTARCICNLCTCFGGGTSTCPACKAANTEKKWRYNNGICQINGVDCSMCKCKCALVVHRAEMSALRRALLTKELNQSGTFGDIDKAIASQDAAATVAAFAVAAVDKAAHVALLGATISTTKTNKSGSQFQAQQANTFWSKMSSQVSFLPSTSPAIRSLTAGVNPTMKTVVDGRAYDVRAIRSVDGKRSSNNRFEDSTAKKRKSLPSTTIGSNLFPDTWATKQPCVPPADVMLENGVTSWTQDVGLGGGSQLKTPFRPDIIELDGAGRGEDDSSAKVQYGFPGSEGWVWASQQPMTPQVRPEQLRDYYVRSVKKAGEKAFNADATPNTKTRAGKVYSRMVLQSDETKKAIKTLLEISDSDALPSSQDLLDSLSFAFAHDK